MKIIGGYTNYGQDIGILMLDTRFPRIIGDIGNANTFRTHGPLPHGPEYYKRSHHGEKY